MTGNPVLFLVGSKRFLVKKQDRMAVLNICLFENISYFDFHYDPEGNMMFRCSTREASRLIKQTKKEGIAVSCIASYGLPAFLFRHRSRFGLFFGSLVGIGILLLSQLFVWEVRVTGNRTMTAEEVIGELRACGFGVGTYLPSVQSAELENRVLLASDRISWISLYVNGTVANVQIIEQIPHVREETSKNPANVIAASDGQIELIALYRGNIAVKVGQAVRKGDLLIGGVYGDETERFRYTRAAGQVFARTERKISVEIPLTFEEKVYQNAKCGEITLNFFDFSAKIFKSAGNSIPTYDIIETDSVPFSFLPHPLPFGWSVTTYLPYTVQNAVRSEQEASDLAFEQLEQELAALSEEVQLLSKRIQVTVTERSVRLECVLECIEDIAVQNEFEITE